MAEPNSYCQPGYCMVPGHPASHDEGGNMERKLNADERRAVRQADFSQVEAIGAWLAADPFGKVQRNYRKRCGCHYRQYCGPGCGAHSE